MYKLHLFKPSKNWRNIRLINNKFTLSNKIFTTFALLIVISSS